MDDPDNNVLVLTIFAGSLVAVIVGYLLAWRSNRAAYRRAGSLMTAVVGGFAGLVGVWWAIGAVSPIPPPDGTSLWGVAVALLFLLAFPLGAFYISARFIRRALRDEHK